MLTLKLSASNCSNKLVKLTPGGAAYQKCYRKNGKWCNMKLVLLSGSFRSQSRSLSILDEIQKCFSSYEFILPKLDSLPFYNEDLANEKPQDIVDLIDVIGMSDGIVVCSPEYNHSIPAVLKNAIDWTSRPAFESVLKDKPITIITQANSSVGGARAQAHIKLIFDSTLSHIHPIHEMMISSVSEVINNSGEIIDDKVKTRLKRHIESFSKFVEQKKL